MSNKVRVRFAPSPTGYLHLGSLRTVLFDYLIAKSLGGKLILRFEDTDQVRECKGATERLIDMLDWLGLKFDEGPHLGGKYGPYIQSQRLEIYQKYANELLAKEQAYRCFCSIERLAKMRQDQQAQKKPPRYDRTCRNLSAQEVAERIKNGQKFVIRQKLPLAGETVVSDELRGEIKFTNIDLEDHILLKADGRPTYQLANVVDDHLMEISHVLRGDEWLSSFPKNILLYRSFGWQLPKFIHLPLTLNKEGGKLSKRQGDVAVEDYQAKGYLPEALLNFGVLQGWHPTASAKAPAEKKDEILSLAEMIKYFDYHDMGSSPAIFDITKLDYFNGYYIRKKDLQDLTKLCLPFFVQTGLIEKMQNAKCKMQNDNLKFKNKITGEKISFDYIKKVVALEQERLKKLSEVGELTEFFFSDKLAYKPELLIWQKLTKEEVKVNLQAVFKQLEKISKSSWTDNSIADALISYIKATNGKVGDYLWPLRAALTGRAASPGPFAVAEVLGKERSLSRIKAAIEKL